MRSRLRTLLGAALALLVLAYPLSVAAAGAARLDLASGENDTKNATPGASVIFDLRLTNVGDERDTFRISFSPNPPPEGWSVNPSPTTVTLNANSSTNVTVQIVVSNSATPGTTQRFTITATPDGDQNARASRTLTVNVIAQTPTATTTATPSTPTPTGTRQPTITLTPTQGPCEDRSDDTLDTAFEIKINIPVNQTLCPAGDEDWYFFGALHGKVYTIDISRSDPGIDPSLGLYDANGNLVAFNDDFPRNGDTSDLKPRLESWRAPANGHYFIRVRDSVNSGLSGAFYTLEVETESYGPTPTLIAEICEDLYEPDGVPEQARLVVVGENQPDHRLCPAGDADWIKFFGAANKTYTVATSNLTVGADTVMVLADRDGVSIIDFNDDFNNTLASRIVFTPVVDGFYFVQVKNIGDIGNQFIGYSLSLTVGGGVTATTVATPTRPSGGGATASPSVSPSASPSPGTATATADTTTTATTRTATPTTPSPTPDSYSLASQKIPVANAPSGRFVDPAFANVWQRSDAPISQQVTERSWVWGPQALIARAEVYDQSPGGLRQVQYFDKARMEITDHTIERGSEWFVTNGLLVRELVEGRVQIGNGSYVQLIPAEITIAGDLNDNQAPTYASLKGLLSPVGDRRNAVVSETINRQGSLGSYDGPARPETRLVNYVPETGHNIPQVFWDFFNQRGPIVLNGRIVNGPIVDWVYAMGYPISEPYWTQVRIGGSMRWVLVQAFERRVLTYTPDNPKEWRVEMGNVGLHYYYWRYGVLPR